MTRASLLLLSIAASLACAAKADLATAVEVERLTAGWVDIGMMDGKHKIVPAAVFVLKNVSDHTLGPVQVNAIFRQVDDPREWSSAYVPEAVGELAPGATTGPITVKGEKGYTSDARADTMLSNANFVDARLELFVRSGSSAWTKLGDYSIDRRLIVPSNTN